VTGAASGPFGEPPGWPTTAQLARGVLAAAGERGLTVAVAESLTGGRLAAALTAHPGASKVVRGSVTSYATDLKASILGVDRDLLAREGAVHPEVARQMAAGVRTLCGADLALATTGVAGPDPQDGQPVGRLYTALATAAGAQSLGWNLAGDRSRIQDDAVRAALLAAVRCLSHWTLG
jgi:nicotinamide-nucleotide amidase